MTVSAGDLVPSMQAICKDHLGLAGDEQMLIVADPSRGTLAVKMEQAARQAGFECSLIVVGEVLSPAQAPPGFTTDLLASVPAALLVTGKSLSHTDERREACREHGTRIASMPGLTVQTIGCGAGTRDGVGRPNLLRVFVGQREANGAGVTDEATVIETNLDDVSPEIVAHCVERLFAGGVLDAFTVPIHMKKGRVGVLLTVLCEPPRSSDVEQLIFAETGTFGVRRHNVRRSKLPRRHETVETRFGPIRIKIGERAGVVSVAPEFEDCKTAAAKHEVPVREVFEAAMKAWHERGGSS